MNPQSKRAYTLTEVMVTLTLFSFVSIGIAAFMLETLEGVHWSTNKSKITNDVRLFTTRISTETLGANVAYVYEDFTAGNRDELADRRDTAQTGDCLVLVYKEPYPDVFDEQHYTKLVIYYRKPDNDGVGSVYRAEEEFSTPVEIDTSSGTNHFEDFLASHFADDSGDHPVVLELSRGLANGQLFRNSGNATFVINGEIIHGNEVKEVTNTYNLTISPRG